MSFMLMNVLVANLIFFKCYSAKDISLIVCSRILINFFTSVGIGDFKITSETKILTIIKSQPLITKKKLYVHYFTVNIFMQYNIFIRSI